MADTIQINIPEYVTIVQIQEATDGSYCYVAYHPELPNCISQGDTPEEAEANLVEATELTITHLVSNKLPIPAPLRWRVSDVPLPMMLPVAPTEAGALSVARSSDYDGTEGTITVPSISLPNLQPAG